MLRKNSPIPRYVQLAETLREQIRQGRLRPGQQLPPERELSERYDISRMTVRQAIQALARDGVLIVEHGLGTFVAGPKLRRDPAHILGFTEEMERQGTAVTSRVIEQARAVVTARVAEALHLADSARVVRIVRLRLAGGAPFLLETVHLPAALVPGLERVDLTRKSLYAVLEHDYGLRLDRADQGLEFTSARDHEAALLEVVPGAALALLEGVTVLDDGRPIEAFTALYRADRFRFEWASERQTSAEAVARIGVVLTR
jgi:GntR family transcriptional regulator